MEKGVKDAKERKIFNFTDKDFQNEIRYHLSNAMFAKNYKDEHFKEILKKFLRKDQKIKDNYLDLQIYEKNMGKEEKE